MHVVVGRVDRRELTVPLLDERLDLRRIGIRFGDGGDGREICVDELGGDRNGWCQNGREHGGEEQQTLHIGSGNMSVRAPFFQQNRSPDGGV
jgi:hypothetical protein